MACALAPYGACPKSRRSHLCRWPILVMQISLVDEGRRVVPIVYYADGGGLYEGGAATAALP